MDYDDLPIVTMGDKDDDGDDETNEPDEIDLEWLEPVDDEEGFFDIPEFLDRRIGLAEEME